MIDKDGGPAFPGQVTYPGPYGEYKKELPGMSLRDYFSAHAPPCPRYYVDLHSQGFQDAETISRWAYVYADAMLEARKADEKKK